MLRNIILTILSRGTVALAMLLNLIISLKFLGAAVWGQLSLVVLNLAIVHIAAEVYSGSSLVYFIPRHSLASIYRKGLFWILICSIVVNLVLFLDKRLSTDLLPHVCLLSFVSALHIFHNFLLLGKERIRIYNLLTFYQPLSNLLALVLLIFVCDIRDFKATLYALYISYCTSLIFSTLAVARLFSGQDQQQPIKLLEVLKLGFINQLGNLSHVLSNRYNYYVLTGLGLGVLGLYSGSTSLVESVWVISAGISPIVLTHIANLRDEQNNAHLTFMLARISFILTALCLLIICLIPEQVYTLLFGKDFSGARDIMLYLSPGVLAIGFSSILSHYFSGLGAQKIQLTANASGMMVTLVLSYYMVNHYGLKGACMVASAAYIVQALVLTSIFMRRNKFGLQHFFQFRTPEVLK